MKTETDVNQGDVYIKMADGSYKPIREMKPGDLVSTGDGNLPLVWGNGDDDGVPF